MGRTNAAAAMAALLAGMLVTLALAADSADSGQSQRGEAGSHDLQAGYAVRGQAWATELFGRRYGRHLLAAVTPKHRDGEGLA